MNSIFPAKTVLKTLSNLINLINSILNKMPCSFCHKNAHTVVHCGADISEFMQPFVDFIAAFPVALRQHYIFLNSFSKPVLTLINRNLGSTVPGTKQYLIGNIIKRCFLQLYRAGALQHRSEEILEAHDNAQMWVTLTAPLTTLRQEMLNLLDSVHRHAFGISIYDLIMQRSYNTNGSTALLADSKAHLRDLKINVAIDAALVVQDCFICCNDKPLAALGCGHSYCTDCLINTAVIRTKSVIICALCREDITDVKVGTEELRAAVITRFAEE